MSCWQYGEHVFAIYDRVQRFLLMFGETFNLWKTPFKYRGQNFFDVIFRNTIHGGSLRRERPTEMIATHYEVFCKQFASPVETGKIYQQKCSDKNSHRPLGITNRTNQSY